MDVPFPATIEELTPELMTRLLTQANPDVEVRDLRVIERSHRGDGSASTADRVVLGLDYAPGRDAGLPGQMVMKTVFLHKRLRFGDRAIGITGALLRGLGRLPLGDRMRAGVFSAIRAYQQRYPHAPDAMYLNEVRFYRDVRPELELEAPRGFASLYDESSRTFGILMEDLTLRSARFPNATQTLSLSQMHALLSTLAALHAEFWESPRLQSDLSWIPTPSSGGMYPVFRSLGLDIIRNQLETSSFKADLIAPLGCTVEQLWSSLWRTQNKLDRAPITLLHGDAHVANTYLLPDGRGGLLDWQLMIRGRWAHDVTYVIVTALSTRDRRLHERDLLAFYLRELRHRGVRSAPSIETAWDDYRTAVAWGLVIGWLITPPENYGQEITAANIQRLVDAARDLQTFERLQPSTTRPS